jgi:hypothetical protein
MEETGVSLSKGLKLREQPPKKIIIKIVSKEVNICFCIAFSPNNIALYYTIYDMINGYKINAGIEGFD